MFDIIPFSSQTFNIVKLAAMLKCSYFDKKVLEFIYLWNQSVHCKCFYTYRLSAWGPTNEIIFFQTEGGQA
ncbi:hypothetical protein FY034_18075 (plasmid) [Trichlorobacter lovleyi]|uniref:hypothetical protein n=1 Tax=Trichlorobacter lovleyi TaxID=313985 RepID=UPI00223FA9C4|nr:hypothetical protein [Trichlorobacter lovleyi]QOX80909.1 hypothetical protein FY034_18075 [Trichlorobacter lovleyi]